MKGEHYKNQHYVPQFYFRNFSEDGKTIGLYLIGKNKHMKIPFKGQCSKKNFYGSNKEIEKSLSPMEDIHAKVIGKIIQKRSLNGFTNQDNIHVHTALVLQRHRTAEARRVAEECSDYLIENYIKELIKSRAPSNLRESLDKAKIKWEGSHSYELLLSLISPVLISDLSMILLINKTSTNYCFSDSPVVLYNPFFVGSSDLGNEGLQSPALTIFLPLNEEICLFLYDERYYEIKRLKKTKSKIIKDEDIRKINLLQFYSSGGNIYYKSEKDKETISQTASSFDPPKRHGNKVIEYKFPEEKMEGGLTKQIVAIHSQNISEKLSFEFLKHKKYIPDYDNIRNQEIYALFEKHWKEIESIMKEKRAMLKQKKRA